MPKSKLADRPVCGLISLIPSLSKEKHTHQSPAVSRLIVTVFTVPSSSWLLWNLIRSFSAFIVSTFPFSVQPVFLRGTDLYLCQERNVGGLFACRLKNSPSLIFSAIYWMLCEDRILQFSYRFCLFSFVRCF